MKKRKEQKELSSIMTRRMLMVGAGQILLGASLVGRLYQLQISQTDNYRRLSERNQFDKRLIQAPRGRLLDVHDRLLAGNSEVFELRVLPSRVGDLNQWLRRVGKIVGLRPAEIKGILKTIAEQPDFLEVTVRTNLTQRELSKLAVLSPVLEGVSFRKGFRRIYPQGWMTAHITGYVSPANKQDVKDNPELRYLPASRIGRSGLERTFEFNLRGAAGVERIEVNAKGKPVRVLRDQQASSGEDIKLSIDVSAQSFAAERLRRGKSKTVPLQNPDVQRALLNNAELRAHVTTGDSLVLQDERGRLVPPESGAATVLDIHTGEVKLLVSVPGYDPNLFSNRLSVQDWRRLNEHPRTPLLNRVTSGLYAPGSTFKMVVLAAALEAGVVSQRTKYDCTGGFEFGDSTFHCWNEKGHRYVDAVAALEQSCDVYFYQIALKTGINRIHNMAQRLGLGLPTGIGFSDEKVGIMPDRDWKMESRGLAWTPGETVVAGIGQGFVLTTPLQLAVMTARIANRKYAVRPSLQAATGRQDSIIFPPLDIAPEIIDVLHRGMRAVTNGSRGTARRYDLPQQGMAGKTGTVQVKRITKEQREKGIVDNIDRPWKERDHALFVAFAPYQRPKYAISLVVEHGGSGSSMAAPIARDILDHVLALDKQEAV